MDHLRIQIENRQGKIYLKDAMSHLAFELNDSSELIVKELLKGTSPESIADQLSKSFENLNFQDALKDTQVFIQKLKDNHFLSDVSSYSKQSIPSLSKVTFAITGKCNLNCKHCLTGNTSLCRKDLPFSKIKMLVSELKELGCRSVSLFGGEPFLRKDIWDIILLFQERSIDVKINTNGTLITKDMALKAKDFNLSVFTVSLDGSDASIQDPLRGTGSFEKNISGIRNLISSGNQVILSTTVTKTNTYDLQKIAELGKDLGVLSVRFNDVHFTGNADCFIEDIRLKTSQKFEVIETVKQLINQFGNFVTGSLVDQVSLIEKSKQNSHSSFPIIIPPCGAGMGSLCIRPDGKVTPCEILWDQVVGNIFESSLHDIYYLSAEMNAFRMPIILTENDIPECKNCSYLNICFSGHRCAPYYFPGKNLAQKAEITCWK